VTSSPGTNFLIAVVALAVLYLAVLLAVDGVKKHRGGEGLAIMDDRPPDPDFLADLIRNKEVYREQMLADWAENHEGEP
jgi:hypothetical protein